MPKKGVGQGKGGGPKTETGKRNSSGNATKHGLCSSNTVILPDEKLSDYEAVQQGWCEEFAPEGYAENKLVDELISADWALIRAGRRVAWAENAAVKDWTEESKHHLELMQRYKTAAERSFYRAWNAVQGLRKDRLRMVEKEERLAERIRELQRGIEALKKHREPVAVSCNRARKNLCGECVRVIERETTAAAEHVEPRGVGNVPPLMSPGGCGCEVCTGNWAVMKLRRRREIVGN